MSFPAEQVKKVLLLLRPEPQSELVAFYPRHLNTSHVLPPIRNEFQRGEENFHRKVINIFRPCVKERVGTFKDDIDDILSFGFLLTGAACIVKFPEFSKPACNEVYFRC